MSTGSLSQGVKRPGRGIDHTTPSGAEVKEGVKFYLDSPCGPSWPVLGRPLPFTYIIYIFFKLWKKGNDLFSFFLSFFLSFLSESQYYRYIKITRLRHDCTDLYTVHYGGFIDFYMVCSKYVFRLCNSYLKPTFCPLVSNIDSVACHERRVRLPVNLLYWRYVRVW